MNAKKSHRFNLRSTLTVVTTVLAMILFWRGAWGLMDLYIFPENEALSYLVTLVLGLFLLYMDDYSLSELSE